LHALNESVRDSVDYVADSTDMATSADAALKQKRGVCQDHAHIFIAAARLREIPARYVTGYMLAEGEQRTHAWAEAWIADLGWVGFDPANRQCPTDAYVRMCSGLDAIDAAPLRGRVQAVSAENLSVDVDMAQEQ
jgi:transglutaminase-like putative cysteine protease